MNEERINELAQHHQYCNMDDSQAIMALITDLRRLRSFLRYAATARRNPALNCVRCNGVEPLNYFAYCADCWRMLMDGE